MARIGPKADGLDGENGETFPDGGPDGPAIVFLRGWTPRNAPIESVLVVGRGGFGCMAIVRVWDG